MNVKATLTFLIVVMALILLTTVIVKRVNEDPQLQLEDCQVIQDKFIKCKLK